MRGTIDRTQADLQRTRQGGQDDMQRQGVIGALAQNNCGAQYQRAAAAAAPQQRGFFETLFGGPGSMVAPPAPGDYPQVGASGYRTLCVRTCDGYYFPISNSTSSTRFAEDEQACQKLCPASEVALYSHRNPGEDIAQAVANNGRLYKDYAERVPLPPRVRRDLRLPAARPELGGRPRPDQGFDRRARRHRGHRGEGEGDEPARRDGNPHRNSRAGRAPTC